MSIFTGLLKLCTQQGIVWYIQSNDKTKLDNIVLELKPGFHYPSSRAELTARQLRPWTRVVETGLKTQTRFVLQQPSVTC